MTIPRSRAAIVAVVVALTAAALAACSSANAPAPITLRFLSSDYGAAEQGLINQFQAANPGIRVAATKVASADVVTTVRATANSGTAADIAQISWADMAQAYQSLPIVPVQKIAGRAWQPTAAKLNQAILRATSYGGETVAMPYTIALPTVFYNATLFKAAGLATPPSTMDQIAADAAAVKRHGEQGVYFDVLAADGSDVLTQSVIDDNGGSVIQQNGVISVDEPPAVTALQMLADLTRSGAQPGVTEQAAIGEFEAGKLGMLVASTSDLAALDKATKGKFHVLTAGFPAFGTHPAAPTYEGSGLVALTRDPARQQAVWKFVQFLSGEAAATTLTEKLGYLPQRQDAVTDPKYLGKYFRQDNRLLTSVKQENDVTTYTFFRGPNAPQAVQALQQDAVRPIAMQGQQAAPTLSKVANTIRNLVGE